MDREKENPYVTKISLERTERKLVEHIEGVDKKHTENFNRLDRTISLIAESNKQLTKSIDSNTEEMKGLRTDMKESDKQLRQTIGHMDKTVMEHEFQLSNYEGKFLSYDKALAEKKALNGKWIVVIGGAFTAFITGMFGLAYVVAEWVLPLIFSG